MQKKLTKRRTIVEVILTIFLFVFVIYWGFNPPKSSTNKKSKPLITKVESSVIFDDTLSNDISVVETLNVKPSKIEKKIPDSDLGKPRRYYEYPNDTTKYYVDTKIKPVEQVKKIEEKRQVYWDKKPYDNYTDFVKYFKQTSIDYEKQYNIPAELILSKLWLETQGFRKGVGTRGNGYGIKYTKSRNSKLKGLKGFDKKDNMKVEYQAYDERWESFSHFCKLLQKPLYKNRYKKWQKFNSHKKDYYNWALALQIDLNLKNSKLAYAMCGCKNGTDIKCYKTRKKHSAKVIAMAEKAEKIIRCN